jgi:hypothetical protein
VSSSDKATTTIKKAIPLVSDVCMATPKSRWQTLASSLATTFHAPSSLPCLMAPLLLYLLPHPPSGVLLAEEVHHRAATTAVHLPQEGVSSLETEPLVNNVFLTASGDEAKESQNMHVQVVVAVVVVNVNAVEEETDLTEPCDKTRYPSKPPPSASTLVSSILGFTLLKDSVLELVFPGILYAARPFKAAAQLDNVHLHGRPKLASATQSVQAF